MPSLPLSSLRRMPHISLSLSFTQHASCCVGRVRKGKGTAVLRSSLSSVTDRQLLHPWLVQELCTKDLSHDQAQLGLKQNLR